MATPEQFIEVTHQTKDGRSYTVYTLSTKRDPIKAPSTDLSPTAVNSLLASIPANVGYGSSMGVVHHNDPDAPTPEPKDPKQGHDDLPYYGMGNIYSRKVSDLVKDLQRSHVSNKTEAVRRKALFASTDPHVNETKQSSTVKIKNSKKAKVEEQNVESIAVDNSLSPEGRIAKHKNESTKKRIMAAYEAYERREPGSMNALVSVCREFAHTKLRHLEYDLKATGHDGEDISDWSQEVSINVWQVLRDGKFTPDTSNGQTPSESFYSWLHKIAFNKASKVFNNLDEHLQTHTTVTVPGAEGEDGNQYVDNPEIYNHLAPEETPYPVLPEWIDTRDPDDIDAAIIRLLSVENVNNIEVKTTDPTLARYFDNPAAATEWKYTGYSYADVAAILNLSTAAVKQRVKKMRDRMQKEQRNPWGEPLPVAAD